MSERLLAGLGLLDAVDTAALTDRSLGYAPVHLGTRDVPIGTLLDLVHRDPGLLPPRTGHLGNWEDIALGRSGPMDFNTAVCGQGHGYPLIYGFTRTETEDGEGDGVYLPGSLVEGGRRRVLPLSSWDGRGFARRDRSRPLFCPLVRTELDGEQLPLVQVHWQRMRAIAGYRFELEAAALVARADAVVEMVRVLLARADAAPNRRKAYGELISHAVGLDGVVDRTELHRDRDGYLLEGHRFASARELAEAVLLPFRALTDPREFFDRIGALPPVLPVMSHLLTSVLTGLFETHRPDGPGGDPFVTHLHWGARAMAGAPPRRTGYFTQKATVRSMRAIAGTLLAELPEARALCVVLLPAPVFMLCPPDSEPGDAELLGLLGKTVRQARPEEAYQAALGWLADHQDGFSDYLRDRFRPQSGVPHDGRPRPPAVPVEPPGFRDLTFRQASAMVAAFEELHG